MPTVFGPSFNNFFNCILKYISPAMKYDMANSEPYSIVSCSDSMGSTPSMEYLMSSAG